MVVPAGSPRYKGLHCKGFQPIGAEKSGTDEQVLTARFEQGIESFPNVATERIRALPGKSISQTCRPIKRSSLRVLGMNPTRRGSGGSPLGAASAGGLALGSSSLPLASLSFFLEQA